MGGRGGGKTRQRSLYTDLPGTSGVLFTEVGVYVCLGSSSDGMVRGRGGVYLAGLGSCARQLSALGLEIAGGRRLRESAAECREVGGQPKATGGKGNAVGGAVAAGGGQSAGKVLVPADGLWGWGYEVDGPPQPSHPQRLACNRRPLARGGLEKGKSLRNANINERSRVRSLPPGHETFSTSKAGGWRLAVGGGWQLAAVGGWRLVVPEGGPEQILCFMLLKDPPALGPPRPPPAPANRDPPLGIPRRSPGNGHAVAVLRLPELLLEGLEDQVRGLLHGLHGAVDDHHPQALEVLLHRGDLPLDRGVRGGLAAERALLPAARQGAPVKLASHTHPWLTWSTIGTHARTSPMGKFLHCVRTQRLGYSPK